MKEWNPSSAVIHPHNTWLLRNFDGGNRCVSTEELEKSSIVVDDGFFGTLANLAFLHTGWIVNNCTTRPRRTGQPECSSLSFYVQSAQVNWSGEHLAYPQAWHVPGFLTATSYDLNIHDIYVYIYIYTFFLHSLHRIAPSPKLFCFQALSQSPVRGSSFNTEASPGALRFCAQRIWSNEKITNACHFCTKCFGFNIWTCYVSTRLAVIGDDAATGHGAAGYNGWGCANGQNAEQRIWDPH